MTDDELLFYKREKLRFNELLGKLNWTENCLLQEVCVQNESLRLKIMMVLERNIDSMSKQSRTSISNKIKTPKKLST